MRLAAQTIARWIAEYGRENARQMVLVHLSGIHCELPPEFRAAHLTAFGL
jgi:hypothetical protein